MDTTSDYAEFTESDGEFPSIALTSFKLCDAEIKKKI
jgi:hypothetical protein